VELGFRLALDEKEHRVAWLALDEDRFARGHAPQGSGGEDGFDLVIRECMEG
jgi:hypothetical protein